jgi:hypothetical protein
VLVVLLLIFAGGAEAGLGLILLLLGALLFGGLLALLAQRLYALLQSGYWIGRDGLRLRWGLRQVVLPYESILDVALMDDLENPVAPPRWSWPGSVLGSLPHPDLGTVEFLAARDHGLVLIGTAERVFAISPEDPDAFLALYTSQSERGAIQPVRAQSLTSSFVLNEAWGRPDLRRLLLLGAAAVVVLLALVGALAPGLGQVPLGFGPDGLALEPVPATQLFLLPALNLLFYVANLMLGLVLYRSGEEPRFTRLLWGANLATSALFLIAILILMLV